MNFISDLSKQRSRRCFGIGLNRPMVVAGGAVDLNLDPSASPSPNVVNASGEVCRYPVTSP